MQNLQKLKRDNPGKLVEQRIVLEAVWTARATFPQNRDAGQKKEEVWSGFHGRINGRGKGRDHHDLGVKHLGSPTR